VLGQLQLDQLQLGQLQPGQLLLGPALPDPGWPLLAAPKGLPLLAPFPPFDAAPS